MRRTAGSHSTSLRSSGRTGQRPEFVKPKQTAAAANALLAKPDRTSKRQPDADGQVKIISGARQRRRMLLEHDIEDCAWLSVRGSRARLVPRETSRRFRAATWTAGWFQCSRESAEDTLL